MKRLFVRRPANYRLFSLAFLTAVFFSLVAVSTDQHCPTTLDHHEFVQEQYGFEITSDQYGRYTNFPVDLPEPIENNRKEDEETNNKEEGDNEVITATIEEYLFASNKLASEISFICISGCHLISVPLYILFHSWKSFLI